MVEKRRSPVGDSPPEAQRRKKLSTRTDADAEPMDVEAPRAPSPIGVAIEAQAAPGAAPPVKSADAEVPTLLFHARFQVLGLGNARAVTAVTKDARDASWRLVWHPRSPTDPTFVGVFVELVVEQELQPPRLAELTIVLVNQGGQEPLVKCTSVHEFSEESAEFGMSQFIQRSELLNPSNKFLDEQGKVEIEVRLSFVGDIAAAEAGEMVAVEEPLHSTISASQDADLAQSTLETTQHLLSYDSKEETGMVGLKNQGATCYLNSLLQTLFHLRAFRQVVYETPTVQEDTNDSVSLALQRVFYRLQRQRKAVSTKELTRSFGWSAIDSFMQHDVQELYRILCDRLEEKMKRTRMDSAIQKLFEGKVRSFVQCVNVDFQSFRDESFYDLQLDVKGCKDLMQSFRKYVEVEMLDGDNQYEAEGHGKQDAKKGIKFLTFPPVLNIQLKRFEYDPMRDGMVKIHDRFEFPKTLMLDEFISDDGKEKVEDSKEKSSRYIYHLHSVLVHSGGVHGGHYYVFIRPGKHIATSTDWFRFDDDHITHVDEQVAVEGNFGSAGTPVTPQDGPTEPPSPLYSSSLFCSPDRNGGNSSEPNGMDGLEFRSVDTEGVPGADGGHAAEEVYDYSQSNDSGSLPLNSTSSSLMLPLARSFSSAYMLVYVRDGENDIGVIQDEAASAGVDAEITPVASSASEDVLMAEGETGNSSSTDTTAAQSELPRWQCDPLPIPEELVTRFHEEEKAVARRKKAQQTEHLYMNLRIASDTSVAKLKRITKITDFSGFNNSSTVRVRIKRAASVRQLYRRLYKETGIPMSRQRLWKVITRENRTTRPDQPLGPDVYGCRVESLIEDDASTKAPVKLYLQILDPPSESSSQPTASPPASPSSPSIHAHGIGKAGKAIIHRHFLDEFSPPTIDESSDIAEETKPSQEMGEEDEDAAAAFAEASESVAVDHAPPLQSHEILLFIKFYDLKKKLGDRLEYVGNIVVDSRITGAELAKCLHEGLSIPYTTELVLYEEIQPSSVSAIGIEATLTRSEIQNGDIICFQFAEDGERANGIVLKPELGVEDDPDAAETTYIGPDGEEVKAVISPGIDEKPMNDTSHASSSANGSRGPHSHGSAGTGQVSMREVHQRPRRLVERYPDVISYFRYLLDRVEVTFHRYGHSEEDSFTLSLLLSNVYDDVIDAVAGHLGLVGPKRLFVRLYQHSPLNSLPMKSPLRHSRYAGDDQTTLEEFLTEYLERTNILYYELLDHPITEIEAKKELLVHLSIYDACFATEQAASPSPVAPHRHIEVLVVPTHKVRDLLSLIRDGFGLPEETPLRACEVVQHGTMIRRVIKEDAALSRYWGTANVSDPNAPEILVEQIPAYELLSDEATVKKEEEASRPAVAGSEMQLETEDLSPDSSEELAADDASPIDEKDAMSDDEERPLWFYKGVVHFNFQNNSQKWIHPHGVPCIVRFSERDTVGDVKERWTVCVSCSMGISSDVFAQWNFALVKDLKASTLQAVYEEMDAEALDAFPMSRLTELCGADFAGLGSLGLEHADPTPPPRHHSNRRLETGIHIRQS
ncbi:Ubiquitin carboxyl-terminal hydrolase 7 [Phytophthora pseudosyringae]|uniref:ubiquitinyl hydrolase 1 n=1 Tax=Phytophthora pseudosyringae TaxID=221518 RepID=A0A8T1VGL0_9STRA|nr:Ubiquitin carboxyl-terminal hydrolase 7 [Phytophthora pseudosyringae]